MKSRFRELDVWKNSFSLSVQIYKLTQKFLKEELYGLTSQMRRCSVSISSNIAEGSGRNSDKEFSHFLFIANGSCNELENQTLLACELGFLPPEKRDEILSSCEEILKQLSKLITFLKKNE